MPDQSRYAPVLVALGLVLALAAVAIADRPRHPDEIRGASTEAVKKAPEGSTPVSGGKAVLMLLGDIDSLNPFTSSSAAASQIHDLLYPRLFIEQPDYGQGPPSFVPNIALKAEPTADGLGLTITLRDATWSDGTPITADDVHFSWQAARSSEVAWVNASIVDVIEDIQVESPKVFTVRYAKKYPYQQMDINDVQVLPKHSFGKVPFAQWQTHGRWEEQAKVAGGPFQLKQLKASQEVVLSRNPRYWKEGRPYLDELIFRIIPDQRTQLTSRPLRRHRLHGERDAEGRAEGPRCQGPEPLHLPHAVRTATSAGTASAGPSTSPRCATR